MTLVQIIAGLYYSIASLYILHKWVGDDYDMARPKTARFRKYVPGEYGLLGFQAGLIYDQKIDETTWATKIPFELKMKRNIVSESGGRRNRPEGSSGTTGPATTTTTSGGPAARDVEMSLYVKWYDLSGVNEVIRRAYIPMIGKANFVSVDFQDMYPLNDNAGGTTITFSNDHLATTDTKHVAEKEPVFFDVVTPLDMTLGGLEDLELSWRVRLLPRGQTTERQLREWFDPVNPDAVQLGKIDGRSESQEIAYDYW